MATVYKTPDVYVEEIPKFPPSISPVETAIPAFIGYTQKADDLAMGDLNNVPKRIGSIAEYEAYFGVGVAPRVTSVTLDDAKKFKTAVVNGKFYMYDSLRLFYANGGGDCYVVSVGNYDNPTGKGKSDFTNAGKGIATLEKEDEPTILVFPDNSLLTSGTDFYDVYDAALRQCGSLMDRVALFHLKEADQKGAEFRSGLGFNNLKYGMTYTPWVKVNFPTTLQYRDFKDVILINTAPFKLADLTDDLVSKTLITDFETVIADVDKVNLLPKDVIGVPNKPLRDQFTKLLSDYQAAKNPATFMLLINFVYDIARKLETKLSGGTAVVSNEVKKVLRDLITNSLKAAYTTLISNDKELSTSLTAAVYPPQFSTGTPPAAPEWGTIFAAGAPGNSTIIPAAAATVPAKIDAIVQSVQPVFDTINSAWLIYGVNASQAVETAKHQGLADAFPLYKSILAGLQNTSSTMPPSGAIAGIYAQVDRDRGVWKAPANVSVTGIIGPKDTFTATELDALNVDPNSGKSINAIRTFTGIGKMVWGARTLAGNDNEWRYVNVRRLFVFVEESVKKATKQFIFEPNDANTWIRAQGMIENFLTTIWRQGALQGIKPEHAFYVAVGLGKTMTALDILEGRMIVEIGMAAVRPAEFIILRFSHMMAQS
jgi:phage tail sheath protein FI